MSNVIRFLDSAYFLFQNADFKSENTDVYWMQQKYPCKLEFC